MVSSRKKMIPYGRQSISEDDIQAVVDVLRSDFLTQGTVVPEFENSVCRYTGAKYGVAVNSATSALHVACLALGLAEGDRLWTTPVTFVASANCGLYCGAKVDFVDIDPLTWNISVDRLEEKLEEAERNNLLPKILVPVHLGGNPSEMRELSRLSEKYGFHIIEDASHAIGGKYEGEPIGNCRFSDITVFSFHPVKIITTGEGGIAVSNNKEIADRMRLLRSHGITREMDEMTQPPDGPWYYQQIDLGFNYRMTDIHAALGLSQLKRLDEFVAKRHVIADQYSASFSGLPLGLQLCRKDHYSGRHLYVIRINRKETARTHREVFDDLRHRGIGVNLHYIPVHLQPYYQAMGFRKGEFKEAESYYEEAISIPMFPGLSESDVAKVIAAVSEAVK